MKTITQLLVLLKHDYLNDVLRKERKGLCLSMYLLEINHSITYWEYLRLVEYLNYNKPITNNCWPYWFPLKDRQSRLDWLDKHIKLTLQTTSKNLFYGRGQSSVH